MAALTNLELAKQNYGRTWTAEMLAKLVEKNKLTATEYTEVTGLPYEGIVSGDGSLTPDAYSEMADAIKEGVNDYE